ncbi:MAG: uL15 family ribosomal protein [Candidatus Paceibacterota bacterium]|jgi:large subunit ribosomal protein L15
MQLHEIKSKTRNKSKRRVGRGGKRGTYSGRGQKGQKARAGRRIKPAQREILLRFPKKRGYKNKPKGKRTTAINIKRIIKLKEKIINKEILLKYGFIAKKNDFVKIIGDTKPDFKIEFAPDIKFSKKYVKNNTAV